MIIDEFIHPSATDILSHRELEEAINKFGSFFTMVSNKPISCVTYFILLDQSDEIKACIQHLTGVSWYEIVEYMSKRYAVLNKSKKIKHESILSTF